MFSLSHLSKPQCFPLFYHPPPPPRVKRSGRWEGWRSVLKRIQAVPLHSLCAVLGLYEPQVLCCHSSFSCCIVASLGHCLQLSGQLRKSQWREKVRSGARKVDPNPESFKHHFWGLLFFSFLFLTLKHMALIL